MAAEKKGQTIVIKKIFVQAGGHGGSWKVALADFMTAMMAFFLVMWLLNQTEETKKAVSDYFSTPSLIEYNFQNFGATISLEKLFLDLINEPLKAFQTFLEPVDKTPNLLEMGSQKVVAAYMADKLGDIASSVNITADGFEFLIYDYELFYPGTDRVRPEIATQKGRIDAISAGIDDAVVEVQSMLFYESVPESDPTLAKRVAAQRLQILESLLRTSDKPNTDIYGSALVKAKGDWIEGQGPRPHGVIRIVVRQKEVKSDGTKYRPLERLFGSGDLGVDVYKDYVEDRKGSRR